MSNTEIEARLLSDIRLETPRLFPLHLVEQPVPQEVFGIRVLEGDRYNVELLDKEIAIYSRSLPGDPVTRRVAALMSIDDALSLKGQIQEAKKLPWRNFAPQIPHFPRGYNPDDYPKARVIVSPRLICATLPIEDIETPYPTGSEGKAYPFAVTSISPISGDRIITLLLNESETDAFVRGMDQLAGVHFRGKSAIEVEKTFSPSRLVTYSCLTINHP